jgi:hypothetical protein
METKGWPLRRSRAEEKEPCELTGTKCCHAPTTYYVLGGTEGEIQKSEVSLDRGL